MTSRLRVLVQTMLAGALLGVLGAVAAQQPAPVAPQGAPAPRPVSPPADSLEPAVNTSATPPAQAAPASAAAPDGKATARPAKGAKAAAAAGGAHGGKSLDRLELDTTQITGNRELPKVLYIVPWKRSDLGDLVGRPVNSLLDEVLTPVDRDVFQRQNRYYDALQPDGAAAKSDAGRGAATAPPDAPK
jgi:hypothetical protein